VPPSQPVSHVPVRARVTAIMRFKDAQDALPDCFALSGEIVTEPSRNRRGDVAVFPGAASIGCDDSPRSGDFNRMSVTSTAPTATTSQPPSEPAARVQR